ncbi:MAG: sulfite oxidase-like oxidoreductase [Acidobacteriia bacterium]|nr:sulfite oxidase-like oxidoreductase [Terriglobia bacterium]
MFTSDRKRKEEEMRARHRLPPGQALTEKWPVLHYGDVPRFDPARWDFRVEGLVENPLRWSWEEFQKLPRTSILTDIHCVTRWSRFDTVFEGVAFKVIYDLVRPRPEARFVMVHAEQDFTANVPVEDLLRDNVLLATHADGNALTPEHGYPLRLVVPHLYLWKSVKWMRGMEFVAADRPGFWERNGYHMYGDPWKEQRFDYD